MLASSTKHKTGDDQRSQPERGAQKKKNPKEPHTEGGRVERNNTEQ